RRDVQLLQCPSCRCAIRLAYDVDLGISNVLRNTLAGFRYELVDSVERLCVDDNLSVRRVRVLGTDGQVEPGWSLADERTDRRGGRMLLDELFDPLQVGARLLDSRSFRRPVVDHHLQAA